MTGRWMAVCVLAALAGCAKGDKKTASAADSLSRDLQLAPVDSTAALSDKPATPPAPAPAEVAATAAPPPAPEAVAPKPQPPAPKPEQPKPKPPEPKPAAPKPAAPTAYTLAAGTEVQASAKDTISSKSNKPGESFGATVPADVKDEKGHVVIPAGSTVTFQIVQLAVAHKSDKDGPLELKATSVSINGSSYPLNAATVSVEHTLQGKGVTGGTVAKVGGGAAAGAIAGRLIGGKKGTVIGGLVGAAAGTAVAVETATRDVVIPAGAAIVIKLSDPVSVPRH